MALLHKKWLPKTQKIGLPDPPLFTLGISPEKYHFFTPSLTGLVVGSFFFPFGVRKEGGLNRAVKNCHVRTFELYRLNPDIPAHYLSRAGSLRSHRGHHFAGTHYTSPTNQHHYHYDSYHNILHYLSPLKALLMFFLYIFQPDFATMERHAGSWTR